MVTGRVSEEQLDKWCKEIDDEETKREQEAQNHVKWLKQRELRKQEIERALRPAKPNYTVIGQKRKTPDVLEEFIDNEREANCQTPPTQIQSRESTPQPFQQHYMQSPLQKTMQYANLTEHNQQGQEQSKPALSPLLTSLLKSPSQVQNLNPVSSSILHTAITSQGKYTEPSNSSASPTIASLLNSTSSVAANLQQFAAACNLPNQDNNLVDDCSQPLNADILDDASLKIDDLAKSILVQDGPFPEIKKEEVDDIISEIIENNHDLVADPEQCLELDGNGDINISLELDELEQEQEAAAALENRKLEAPPTQGESSDINTSISTPLTGSKTEEKAPLPPTTMVDPFEFQEDPVLFESPVKPSTMKQDNTQYVPLYQQQSPVKTEESERVAETLSPAKECQSSILAVEPQPPPPQISSSSRHGSVEIVEVPASEEQESQKDFDKSQIRDMVFSSDQQGEVESTTEPLESLEDTSSAATSETNTAKEESQGTPEEPVEDEEESKDTTTASYSQQNDNSSAETTSSPTDINVPSEGGLSEFTDDLYDNINMEVKIDKTGKAKRDYSRPKKKEEKNFDMLLAIEKAQLDSISDDLTDFKDFKIEEKKQRLKSETERSISPWTEEEDLKPLKPRYSTPATPIDSLPNSPASSIAYFDDDKDYRNWKKSVMLVYNRLASNKYASLFLKPITEEQAPGYNSIVYRPMDLQTIKKNIDSGIIRNSLEFKRDVMLMFTNAIMYNKTNDTVYSMALQMQQESMEPIEILLQAEAQVDAPSRRETRTSDLSCKRKRVSDDPIKSKKKKED